jgi:hypothetical protein
LKIFSQSTLPPPHPAAGLFPRNILSEEGFRTATDRHSPTSDRSSRAPPAHHSPALTSLDRRLARTQRPRSALARCSEFDDCPAEQQLARQRSDKEGWQIDESEALRCRWMLRRKLAKEPNPQLSASLREAVAAYLGGSRRG